MGEELWYAKRYRRLLAMILPAIKKRYDAIIGRWYKANLAHFEEVAKDTKTENEYSEYLKVRARLETAHYKARQEAGRIHVKTSR